MRIYNFIRYTDQSLSKFDDLHIPDILERIIIEVYYIDYRRDGNIGIYWELVIYAELYTQAYLCLLMIFVYYWRY